MAKPWNGILPQTQKLQTTIKKTPLFSTLRVNWFRNKQNSHAHVYCRQCQPICRSIVGRDSVETRSIQRSIVGRDTVDSRSRCVSADIAFRSPILHRHLADFSPTLRRLFVDTSPMYWSVIGQLSVDGRSTLDRQLEDSKNTLKNSCGNDGVVSLTPMAVLVD